MKKVITKNCRLRTKGLFKIERKLILLCFNSTYEGPRLGKVKREFFHYRWLYNCILVVCKQTKPKLDYRTLYFKIGKNRKKRAPPFTFPSCLVCYPYHPLMQKMQIIFRHQHNQIICKQTVLNQCLEVRNRPHVQILFCTVNKFSYGPLLKRIIPRTPPMFVYKLSVLQLLL